MHPTLTRSTRVIACAAAVVTLAACGGADGKASTSPASSESSSEPTYDDDYAYHEAEKVEPQRRAHDPNKPLPQDTQWATDQYVKAFNTTDAKMKQAGVVAKGKIKVTSTHPGESDPDAPGGWDLTMYQCSTSTVRYFKGTEDVTTDPSNSNKSMPKGSRDNAHLLSFTTPDGGKSWQLDKVQLLLGQDEKRSPCEKN